jgi:hypothetical protein
VEEEIPPKWQLLKEGENTSTEGGEKSSHHTHYLAAEHLELLFDIRQRQDE